MRRRLTHFFAACVLIALGTDCGGGGSDAPPYATLRIRNALVRLTPAQDNVDLESCGGPEPNILTLVAVHYRQFSFENPTGWVELVIPPLAPGEEAEVGTLPTPTTGRSDPYVFRGEWSDETEISRACRRGEHVLDVEARAGEELYLTLVPVYP